MKAWFYGLGPEQRGIVLMIGAMALFSLMDAVAKYLMKDHPPMQVVWARYVSQTFWVFLLLSPRLRTLMRTRYLGIQLLRSALLFGGTMFFFLAISQLELAEATAIFEVSPLVVTILSVLILRETVGPRRWLAVLCGLCGALIIIRPGSDVFQIAAIFPVLAASCYAGYSIATRFLGEAEPALTSFLYTALIGTIFASFIAPFYWVTPDWPTAAVMLGFGSIGGLGHFLLIIALTYAKASTIAPFTYAGLLFATTWGMLFYGEYPDMFTILGSLVIVGAGLYVWHRERQVG